MPVPWRYVNSWLCNGCGLCCREFEVVLTFKEWLKLVKNYGISVTKAGLNSFYIAKNPEGTCLFLSGSNQVCLCGLQNMKPMACKIWPFKILDQPKYGRGNDALFNYDGRRLFVYIDPFCPGIGWGKPSQEFVYKVVPEFIQIALGLREKQVYSTSMMLNNLFAQTKRDYRII